MDFLLMDFQFMDFQLIDYIVYRLQLLMDFQFMDFQFMKYLLMKVIVDRVHVDGFDWVLFTQEVEGQGEEAGGAEETVREAEGEAKTEKRW